MLRDEQGVTSRRSTRVRVFCVVSFQQDLLNGLKESVCIGECDGCGEGGGLGWLGGGPLLQGQHLYQMRGEVRAPRRVTETMFS